MKDKDSLTTIQQPTVLVVGYYGHYNLGDEQYKTTIQHILKQIFQSSNRRFVEDFIDFIDCDRLLDYDVPPNTVILLGGGDVLNHYFLDKLNHKFPTEDIIKYKYRIIAFSVGIPYNDIFILPEQNKKLRIFDAIFLRTRQDIPLFSEYFPAEKLFYLPDTSCFVLDIFKNKKTMETNNSNYYTSYHKVLRAVQIQKKIVGVSLCRHIYHPDAPYRDNYMKIVRDIALMLYQLVKDGYYIVLVPFNTKPLNGSDPDTNQECDLLIQKDVVNMLSDTVRPYVLNLDFELTLEEMMAMYDQFHVMIPMRFHATLFSVYAGIPMIPIYTTKKIQNFLLDIDWKYEYVLEKNSKDLPIRFDRRRFLAKFTELTKSWNYSNAKEVLFKAQRAFKTKSMECLPVIWNAMTFPFSYSSLHLPITNPILKIKNNKPIQSIDTMYKNSENNIITDVIPPASEITLVPNVLVQRLANKLQEFAHDHNISDFREIKDPSLQNIAVCVVSWYLTGLIDSQYNHGLMKKMFNTNYDYQNEWTWVTHDWNNNVNVGSSTKNATEENEIITSTRNLPILCDISFNPFTIDYIDQNDRSGAHRSGWKYVYQYIKQYSTSNKDLSKSGLLLDLYVDRTFHWKRDIFKYIGIVPYTQPWMGVIHHTFDTTFSEYNNETLLKCPEFLESLDHCKGIIVLSKTLQEQFQARLPPSVLVSVPIFVLTHPTEMNVPKFDYQAFLENSDKKLLHVGGWLRNIFSFYQLDLSKDKYMFQEDHKPSILVPLSVSSSSPIQNSWYKTLCCQGNLTDVAIPTTIISSPIIQVYTPQVGSTVRKVILKGKYMDNYFPNDATDVVDMSDITVETEKTLEEDSNQQKMCSTTSPNTQNNWHRHMNEYLQKIQTNMDVLDYIENGDYDEILTKNLVFLHLVDGSAINTLIECIVRMTPIFVNRHPSVVELLGETYPLYYTIDDTHTIPDIDVILRDPTSILRAHQHLSNMDKTPFMIETFLKDLSKVLF